MLSKFKSDVLWNSINKQTSVESIYKKNIDNNFILQTFLRHETEYSFSLEEFCEMKSFWVRQMEMIPTLFVASNVLSGVKTILKDFAFRSSYLCVCFPLTSHTHAHTHMNTWLRPRKLFQVAKQRVYTERTPVRVVHWTWQQSKIVLFWDLSEISRHYIPSLYLTQT